MMLGQKYWNEKEKIIQRYERKSTNRTEAIFVLHNNMGLSHARVTIISYDSWRIKNLFIQLLTETIRLPSIMEQKQQQKKISTINESEAIYMHVCDDKVKSFVLNHDRAQIKQKNRKLYQKTNSRALFEGKMQLPTLSQCEWRECVCIYVCVCVCL